MATLRYTQIHATTGATIRYIANKDKMITSNSHDVYNVLNYMGEPESTERVYSYGHHCSANPVLAEKQFEMYRQRYFEQKTGGIQGMTKGSSELLALHFFMSYSKEDNPSPETMDEILTDVIDHTKLKDFPVFRSNHFDKTHRHSHFLVGQYAAEGKPRKLCMHKDDYDDIRRYANRVCVAHGLSIIDLAILRKDLEYSDWLDRVIAEGKVTVHPEREEHKQEPKQKQTTKGLYYKWLKEQEEFNLAEEKKLTEAQLHQKRADEKYFYSVDGKTRHPVSAYKGKRYYSVRIYTPEGRKRSTLELLILLIKVIANEELKYVQERDERVYRRVITAKRDWKAQGMMDCIAVARETNIENPDEVSDRIAEIGKQMNDLKTEKRRHENSIKKHELVLEAYRTYDRVRESVEGVDEPEPDALAEYKKAYAVLAANQCLDADGFQRFLARYEFEKRKVIDYDEKMPKLNKQYRDLKRLEALVSQPMNYINEIYSYTEEANNYRNNSLDDIIINSEKKKVEPTNDERKSKDYGTYDED